MKKMGFYFNKKMVYVDFERTSNKNAYIKISKDNTILVTAPKGMSEMAIRKFVDQHIHKFVKYVELSKQNELYSIKESFIYILGKKYKIEVLTGFKRSKVLIKNSTVYLMSKIGDDSELENIIKKYLKESLENYINLRQPIWEKKMDVPSHSFKVIYKTSTWGTNMVTKKSISYSSRLMHFEEDVIDYVIVHELAHNIEPNHSISFWNIVKKYVKNYKDLRKKLKNDETM